MVQHASKLTLRRLGNELKEKASKTHRLSKPSKRGKWANWMTGVPKLQSPAASMDSQKTSRKSKPNKARTDQPHRSYFDAPSQGPAVAR